MLVFDDDENIAGLVKHVLEGTGDMEVEICATGDTALDAVRASAPDLLVLGLNLPVIGGFEMCRILRGRPATARLPIIMLTARGDENDRIAGLDAGADDCIAKPFSVHEFSARVRAALRRARVPADTTGEPRARKAKTAERTSTR